MYRLDPIDPPFSGDVSATLAGYPQRNGYVLKLFRVFANSLRFLKKGTLNLLDKDSPLTLRQRELVILRTCANNRCEYEWGVHVGAFAGAAGFDRAHSEDTARTRTDVSLWSAEEQLLLDAVDALCATGTLDDHLKARFQTAWDAAQQLEILALCGNYHTISFVANVSRVTSEDFAVSFPPDPSPLE